MDTICGGAQVGKSTILLKSSTKTLPEYIPRVVDVMTRELLVDGQQFSLNGSEACSSEEYERIRPLQYRNPSTSPDVDYWAPEIQQHCPNVPVILVGMKIDLRQDEAVIESCRRKHAGPIEFEQGAAMAREIGAVAYLECSTLTEDGLEELFERLCRVYLSHKTNSHNRLSSQQGKAWNRQCIIS